MNQSIKSHSFPILPVIRITIAITLVLLLIYYNVLPTYAQNSAKEYYDSGVVKANSGDYEGAIEDYDKAIEIDHRYYATAYFNRGAVKWDLGDDRGEAYYNRGLAKGNLGDYRGAIEDYNKAIKINPKFSKAYYGRGVAKGNLGDYRGAIEDYDKATIWVNHKFADAYYNRGLAKGNLRDIRGAIEDYNRVIEIDPGYAETYYHRGVAKIALSQQDSGCLDLSKAGVLGFDKAYESIKKYCK